MQNPIVQLMIWSFQGCAPVNIKKLELECGVDNLLYGTNL
jgi:hypothetical protein